MIISRKNYRSTANSEFNICKNYRSISGHSMGGHGALTITMKDEGKSYASVSAFAPIVTPAQVIGEKKHLQII